MNKFFSIIFILSLILISSCKSKSPEEKKCNEMMEHMYDLTINSESINSLSSTERNEAIDSLRGEFEAKKNTSIKQCAKDFNKSTYNCIMNSQSTSELNNCN